MMYWSGDWNAWAWVAMTGSMLVFWALVGAAVWALVRRPEAGVAPKRSEDADDVLRRRYAAGEIDDEEFERRRQSLQRAARS